ncbi:ficolin-1-like isoform X2 [Diadema setosum]|uniref:ficolin-1-like isoform X2 n=1 Tax=Diadema setosum TaxID=31175 RepID=UPI003B3B95B5
MLDSRDRKAKGFPITLPEPELNVDIAMRDSTAKATATNTPMDAPVPDHPEKTEEALFPRDCSEIDQSQSRASGLYEVRPAGGNPSFQVYCDMDTDGGNWTVFQRRSDGTVLFSRGWIDYKTGFGNPASEHWLGNDKIYQMTSQRNYELRIDMTDEEGSTRFAKYEFFRIDNETMKYRLHIDGYLGDAGESMDGHNGAAFSTWDSNNDESSILNCARQFSSGWWFKGCFWVNLNGLYRLGKKTHYCIIWKDVKGTHTLKSTEMKMRPASLEKK